MGKNPIKVLLADNGFRVTEARRAVLQILMNEEKPVDVALIESTLENNQIEANQVTIYRMLEAFVEKGLVTRLDFQEGKFRYELSKSKHHHAICEKCGTVADVKNCAVAEMEKDIANKHHFLVKRHALEFFGLCANCQ